ncbi:HORMA domain-containing protein [Mycena indigotica]|uniref:HORMA domain-containing protein n=1 Tax=Mycena indigotica TaxID=2126181 RepID=A0A8H6SW90_9AGAR|nr:HORMA domain-containing protein [Mycena indigotica]KAF7307078.1 HORMA domain-containing protein [Mycena indigotica]
MATPLTYNQTVRGITEFIEVAIHTILYVRQIYPADLFIRRKKYDTPVFQSRHPALNEYISNAVKAIAEQLLTGNLEKVAVVIKNKEQVALERFLFSIENMIQIEDYDKNTNVQEAMSASDLGQYFRGFLVKLNMVEAQLGQMHLGDDVSFTITIELKPETLPSTKTPNQPPWIPAFTQQTTAGTSDESELHMIRAVNTGIINLSLAVQETDVKLKHERETRENMSLSRTKPTKSPPDNSSQNDAAEHSVADISQEGLSRVEQKQPEPLELDVQ